MLPVLIIATSIVFIILIGILTLTFFIPFVNNILEIFFKGELAVSVIEMFLIVFILCVIIFGGFTFLIGLI